ncbi:mRNA surveillance protein pelota [Candidatus Woesearchaeota archaeon]|nr:mRNA surveillance protein pelota [Candidatus Woesearchaeota archaeon]
MDILQHDFKKGIVTIRINNLDDLWYLHGILETGDLVRGKMTRKVKIGDSENATVTKKTLTLTIQAETIEFGATATSLRINGKIKEGPDDLPKESYQAISLEEGSEATITKPRWLSYQQQQLEESAQKKYLYLFCLFDREEALFAITKKYGFETLSTIQGDVAKKENAQPVSKDFYQEIIKNIEEYSQRYQPQHIILASPAFYKEDLAARITLPSIKSKLVLATCYDVTQAALNDIIKQPELTAVLKNSRAHQEQILVDQLLKEINTQGKASYGWKLVLDSINQGAAQDLLITEQYLRTRKEKNTFQELEDAMSVVEKTGGKIHIISSQHDAGTKLDGLGGIAAILRYKTY